MAFGLGLSCCCNRCASLKNCATEDVITSTSDLSAYEVGDVLPRDESEGGGCWELLSLTAACSSPETFTVDGDPFTGETACQDCLEPQADGCQECGSSDDPVEGQPGVTADITFIDFGFGNAEDENGIETSYLGSGQWEFTKTITCGENELELKFEWFCQSNSMWLVRMSVNGVPDNTTQPTHAGSGLWEASFGTPFSSPLLDECIGESAVVQVNWHHTECEPEI